MSRILIIRLSSLGDVLLTTPLLRAAAKQYPDAVIDYCVRKEYADVLRYNPYITNLFEYSRDDYKNEELAKKLSLQRYRLTLDLQNNRRSKRLTNKMTGEVRKFGKRSLDKFILVQFHINRLRDALPIPERYAESTDIALDNEGLDFFFPDKYKEHTLPDNAVTLCPGARHFTKRYPAENFIEVGTELRREGYEVIITGGSSDKEVCDKVAGGITGSHNLVNENNLFYTAEILTKSIAVVCNDSGLMHLASAVGTPTVALFGSTVKEFGFRPYRNRNIILENNSLSCRPCSHIGRSRCPKRHFDCMKTQKPEMVIDAIRKLLSGNE